MMGTSSAYLYRRLNGETAFDVEDLERLAAVLDVSVVSLFPAQERTEGITLDYSVIPAQSSVMSPMSQADSADSTQTRRAA